MFGIQFYPTPKPMVEMMMDKVEWSGVRFVLEPSAGKGDLVDGVAKRLKGKVHQIECVEIDPDLREVLLLKIDGGYYFIGDILLRMLTPRELYNAMGFPPDYIIDHDYRGNVYGKTKQVARCGNAVCPPMATALVRANLPEWCSKEITSMEQLEQEVAV